METDPMGRFWQYLSHLSGLLLLQSCLGSLGRWISFPGNTFLLTLMQSLTSVYSPVCCQVLRNQHCSPPFPFLLYSVDFSWFDQMILIGKSSMLLELAWSFVYLGLRDFLRLEPFPATYTFVLGIISELLLRRPRHQTFSDSIPSWKSWQQSKKDFGVFQLYFS